MRSCSREAVDSSSVFSHRYWNPSSILFASFISVFSISQGQQKRAAMPPFFAVICCNLLLLRRICLTESLEHCRHLAA